MCTSLLRTRTHKLAEPPITRPADQPTGAVRVASFGLNVFQLPSGRTTLAVHVRLVVANNADEEPWTVDPRSVAATFAGEGRDVAPAFLSVDGSAPRTVEIPRGQQRTIDLYFPLPHGVSREEALPGFDVTWQVETGKDAVAERTRFEREPVDDTAAYASHGYAGYAYPYAYGYFGFGYPLHLSP